MMGKSACLKSWILLITPETTKTYANLSGTRDGVSTEFGPIAFDVRIALLSGQLFEKAWNTIFAQGRDIPFGGLVSETGDGRRPPHPQFPSVYGAGTDSVRNAGPKGRAFWFDK